MGGANLKRFFFPFSSFSSPPLSFIPVRFFFIPFPLLALEVEPLNFR